jgi:hypothetical protein
MLSGVAVDLSEGYVVLEEGIPPRWEVQASVNSVTRKRGLPREARCSIPISLRCSVTITRSIFAPIRRRL